jgi:hypothetical protein
MRRGRTINERRQRELGNGRQASAGDDIPDPRDVRPAAEAKADVATQAATDDGPHLCLDGHVGVECVNEADDKVLDEIEDWRVVLSVCIEELRLVLRLAQLEQGVAESRARPWLVTTIGLEGSTSRTVRRGSQRGHREALRSTRWRS